MSERLAPGRSLFDDDPHDVRQAKQPELVRNFLSDADRSKLRTIAGMNFALHDLSKLFFGQTPLLLPMGIH